MGSVEAVRALPFLNLLIESRHHISHSHVLSLGKIILSESVEDDAAYLLDGIRIFHFSLLRFFRTLIFMRDF